MDLASRIYVGMLTLCLFICEQCKDRAGGFVLTKHLHYQNSRERVGIRVSPRSCLGSLGRCTLLESIQLRLSVWKSLRQRWWVTFQELGLNFKSHAASLSNSHFPRWPDLPVPLSLAVKVKATGYQLRDGTSPVCHHQGVAHKASSNLTKDDNDSMTHALPTLPLRR